MLSRRERLSPDRIEEEEEVVTLPWNMTVYYRVGNPLDILATIVLRSGIV